MFSFAFRRLVLSCLMPCVVLLGFPQRSYAIAPLAAVAWVVSYAGGVYRAVQAADIVIGTVIAGIAFYADTYLNSSTPPSVTPTSTAGYVDVTPATLYNQNKNPVNTDSSGNTVYRVNYSGSSSTPITNLSFGCAISAPNLYTAQQSLSSCIPTNALGSCTTKYVSTSPDYTSFNFNISCNVSVAPVFAASPSGVSVSSSSAAAAFEGTPCQFRNVSGSFYSNGASGCSSGPLAGIQSSPTSPIRVAGGYSDQSISFSLGDGAASSGASLSLSGSASRGISGVNATTGPYDPALGGYPVTGVTGTAAGTGTGTGTATGTGTSSQVPPFVMPCGIAGTPACSVSFPDVAVSATPSMPTPESSDRPDPIPYIKNFLPSAPSLTLPSFLQGTACHPINVSYHVLGRDYSHSWDFCRFINFFKDVLSYLAYIFTCTVLYGIAIRPRSSSPYDPFRAV